MQEEPIYEASNNINNEIPINFFNTAQPNYDIENNEFNNNSDLNGTYSDIYTAFDNNEATLENNTYSGDNTTKLNDKIYDTIVDIPGAKIELIENR